MVKTARVLSRRRVEESGIKSMTRPLLFATAMLLMAALLGIADDTGSSQTTPEENASGNTATGDPPAPNPETSAERTVRVTKLLRDEINGDTRRILDTTFA